MCKTVEIEGVCVLLEEYDADYAVCPDGTVWSRKGGEWEQKSTWDVRGVEVVELWRHGKRTQRAVHVLQQEAFGENQHDEDDELRRYLRRQYPQLNEDEIDAIFEEEDDDE